MVTRGLRLTALPGCLVALGLLACDPGTTDDQTGLLLNITGEYTVPDDVDRLVLQVFDIDPDDGARRVAETVEFDLAALQAMLPTSLGLLETREPPASKLGFRLDAFKGDGVLPVAWVEWIEATVPSGSHAEVPLALVDYPGLFVAVAGAPAICPSVLDIASADTDGDLDFDLFLLCEDAGANRTLQGATNDSTGKLTKSPLPFDDSCGKFTSLAMSPRTASTPADLFAGAEAQDHVCYYPSTAIQEIDGVGTASFPTALKVADIDDDGFSDLVWLNLVGLAGQQLAVLFGDDNGITQDDEQVTTGAARFPQDVAVADFDNDRDLDLFVVAKGETAGQAPVGVLVRNKGSRSFEAAAEVGIGAVAGDLAPAVVAGDFDGDDKPDVAVAVQDGTDPRDGHNGYAILWGKGDGSFEAAVFFAAGHENLSLAAADFNRDGIDDLALADRSDDLNPFEPDFDGVALFLGKGDRSFELLDVAGDSLDHPRSLWVDDLNGDSSPDLIVGIGAFAPAGDEKLHVLLGRP